jgi:V8-like Glu-specific endopeptidase
LFGKNDRRSAYLVAAIFLAAAFAFPALAAASYTNTETAEEGVVLKRPLPSPGGPWDHWTQEELEEAVPLPVVTLPESPEAAQESAAAAPSGSVPGTDGESASGSASRTALARRTAALEGIEVGADETTVFPNNVNGQLFGEFQWRDSENHQLRQKFSCSGSIVSSPHGNVIVTAGHCAIDAETGHEINSSTIFIPGYRKGTEPPYGTFRVAAYSTPQSWEETAKPGLRHNEGADIAFMELWPNSEGETVEEVVESSMGISFDQPCGNTYTQFGYPADYPYPGEYLYSNTAAYAGADSEAGFAPVPMKIASDFTRGASGGPWVVEASTGPTVLSVTAYGYADQPGYLYGPYFGETAKKSYGLIIGRRLLPGIEESCLPLPSIPTPTPTPTAPVTPSPTPTPTPETTPTPASVMLKVVRVRRLANGRAVLTARVNTAGQLNLSGAEVRAETVSTAAAGQYRMVVSAKGATNRRLRQVGRAKVGVKVAFSAAGKTKRVNKKIALSRPAVARAAQQHAAQSR